MVKKFTANCSFGDQSAPVDFYVGDSAVNSNPIGFQLKWLAEKRGGFVPQNLTKFFAQIKKISDENHISFEDLSVYIAEEIKARESIFQEHKKFFTQIQETIKLLNYEK
jgi:hypothetical protein